MVESPLRLVCLSLLGLVALGSCSAPTQAPEAMGGAGGADATVVEARIEAARSRQTAKGFDFVIDSGGVARSKAGGRGITADVAATARGVRLTDGFSIEIETVGVARGAERSARSVTRQRVEGQELVFEREGGVEERYLTGPLGVEQSYLLREKPAGEGPLTIEVAFDGLAPRATDEAPARVLLVDAERRVRGGYRDLAIADADGRAIAGRMEVRGKSVALVIDDAAAKYPLRIDPLVWVQQAESPEGGGADGGPCADDTACVSGHCVDGVCCDTDCGGGSTTDCQACSVAAGASADGTCTQLTGTSCNDGDACTKGDTCEAGVCKGTNAVTCAPIDQCHAAGTCDPLTGTCSNPPVIDGTACNDGNACTKGDTCQAGVCTGGAPVICAPTDPCHAAGTCDPSTGSCSNPAQPDGTACNDGNACSSDDVCTAGMCCGTAYTCAPTSCQASSACDGKGGCTVVNKAAGVACPDDGNACTADACDGAGACQHPSKADGTSCGVGQVCAGGSCASKCFINGTLYAAGAVSPQNPCLVCTPALSTTAWSNGPDGVTCDDGNACTKSDVCTAGTCGGTAYTCAPTSCQVSSTCDGNGGCLLVNKPSGTACPDDGNACSSDLCDGAGTCTHPPLAEGASCGAGQICEGGSCGPKCQIEGNFYAAGTVNPANACQQCTPASSTTAWSNRTDGTTCDDGNACTKNDVCTAGACGGAAYTCAPGNCDASSTCDGKGGCVVTHKGSGVACADDGNACTSDTCDGAGTCAHATLADGTICAPGQICQGGACAAQCFIDGVFVPAATMNPANPCEICAPGTSATSWTSKVDGAPCSDGDACTQTDTCQAGVCVGADPVTCSALDPCHDAGSCDPQTGACSNPPKANGSACDDGDACTQKDSCQAGICTGGNPVLCAAVDQCHDAGTCDKTTGVCSNPLKGDGAICDDGNACTQKDTCLSGVCVSGNPKSCVAADECHWDGTCDQATGACSKPAKDDGEACSKGTCQAGVCTAMPDGGMGGAGGSTSASGSGGAGGAMGSGGAASTGGAGGAMGTGGSSESTSGSSTGSSSSSSGKTPEQSGGCGCRAAGEERSAGGSIGVVVGLMLALGASRRRARR